MEHHIEEIELSKILDSLISERREISKKDILINNVCVDTIRICALSNGARSESVSSPKDDQAKCFEVACD